MPKLQFDSVMHKSLPHHSRAHSRIVQQIDSALLENSRAHAFLDVLPAPRLQHDRFDSLQMQKMGKQKSGRSSTDNSNLSSHAASPSVLNTFHKMFHGCCSENTSIAI